MASKGGPFRFRVSDAVVVPLRGMLLRLRLMEGTPAFKELGVGRTLRLASPDGTTRDVAIKAHSLTAGRQSQKRLDATRELDVIIDNADATIDGVPIEIGWSATGPVDEHR